MDLIILSMTLLFSVALAFAMGHAFLDLVFFFLLRSANPMTVAAHAPDAAGRETPTGTFVTQPSS